MQYAFMTFSMPGSSLEEVLDAAARYGYEGVEPRMDARHKHGIEADTTGQERRKAGNLAAEKGVVLACLATSLRYAKPEDEARAVSDTHVRIDLAADCGIPCLRVFGGARAEGATREDGIAQVVKCLRQVADHAAERGVVLCFETHDDWCHPDHVAAVIREVHHPAIGVNWDIMHPVRTAGVSVDYAFDTLKPYIRHIHMHDGVQDEARAKGGGGSIFRTIGEGMVDHKLALERMRSTDYRGVMSGEWINWCPAEEHLPRELAVMKRYEKELCDAC